MTSREEELFALHRRAAAKQRFPFRPLLLIISICHVMSGGISTPPDYKDKPKIRAKQIWQADSTILISQTWLIKKNAVITVTLDAASVFVTYFNLFN